MNRSNWKNLAIALLLVLTPARFLAAHETASQRPQKVLRLRYKGVIAISPDERHIANASSDKQGLLSVRALPSGREVKHRSIRRRISCLAFSPDGMRLAIAWRKLKALAHETTIGTHRIGVSLWDLKGRYRDFEMVKGDWVFNSPTQLRFSPDGKILWMASSDNLRAWSISSGKLKWQWRGSERRDSSLPFFSAPSKDCRLNFRSDSTGYTVWDTATRKRLLHAELPFLADADLNFSPDASIATYYADTPQGKFNPVIDTRTVRMLWQSRGDTELTLITGKALMRNENTFEVRNSRSGRLLYHVPNSAKAFPVPSESSRWLYTVSATNELFRQPLH